MLKAELKQSSEQELWHLNPRAWLTMEFILSTIINTSQKSPGTPAHSSPTRAGFTAWWSCRSLAEKKLLELFNEYKLPSPLREQAVIQITEQSQVILENHLSMWKYVLSLLTWRNTSLVAFPADQWKGRLAVFTHFCTVYCTYKQHFALQAPSPASYVLLHTAIPTHCLHTEDGVQHWIHPHMFLLNTDKEEQQTG